MSECDNCLCHLEICKAECCKEFKVGLPGNVRLYKGLTINFYCKDEDMLDYYMLHGCRVVGNIVFVKLDKFKREGKELIINNTCEALTKKNTCSLHNTPAQPKICTYPNKTGTGGKVYLTPNCVFKK
jgi:hypothetical protein